MPLLSEQHKKEELKHMKEFLEEIEVAAEVLESGNLVEETCLMICLPTWKEDWKEEMEDQEDLHFASGYLMQLGEEDEQLTKYLALYMPIQVDLTGISREKVLEFVNTVNLSLPLGTCFYAENPSDGRMMIHVKYMIGGYVEEFLDEGVVCETVLEMGYAYDTLKEQLLELVKNDKDHTKA